MSHCHPNGKVSAEQEDIGERRRSRHFYHSLLLHVFYLILVTVVSLFLVCFVAGTVTHMHVCEKTRRTQGSVPSAALGTTGSPHVSPRGGGPRCGWCKSRVCCSLSVPLTALEHGSLRRKPSTLEMTIFNL